MALNASCHPGINDPRFNYFFKSSYGLVFFGVPNLGIKNKPLQEMVKGQLSAELITELQVDDELQVKP